jgi:acetoin utilization deacetylase AcuC-like enzyme
MPTGYTNGIINGTIKSFKQFALKCSEAFLIQFREGVTEYTPSVPSDYHPNQMKMIKEKIAELNQISDSELIAIKVAVSEQSIAFEEESLAKAIEERKIIDKILEDAKNFNPPTDKHQEFKDFMVNQLVKTIDFDFDIEYKTKRIERLKKLLEDLKELTPFSIRAEKLNRLNEDYKYHEERYKKEVQACEESNRWYKELVTSLDD